MIRTPIDNLSNANAGPVSLRCPRCSQNGTFASYGGIGDIGWTEPVQSGQITFVYAGMRQCPNGKCRALVFIIANNQKQVIESFPPQLIDFDPQDLPIQIKDSLEEAIKCHGAAAYRASTLMIRRTLEELCLDRNASGKDLKQRLQSLGQNIILPQELLDAADELRLLGNDAAHIEAKTYDSIGKNEAGLAIELAKELLKAVYQYASLVEKLRGLRRST